MKLHESAKSVLLEAMNESEMASYITKILKSTGKYRNIDVSTTDTIFAEYIQDGKQVARISISLDRPNPEKNQVEVMVYKTSAPWNKSSKLGFDKLRKVFNITDPSFKALLQNPLSVFSTKDHLLIGAKVVRINKITGSSEGYGARTNVTLELTDGSNLEVDIEDVNEE
jgi:hypothetical protein